MTNEQKQHLLAYLGLYKVPVDDIWGEASVEATKEFQRRFGLDDDGIWGKKTESRILEVIYKDEKPQKETTGSWWDEIEYFSREEFRCQCGGKYCNGFPAEPKEKLVRLADQVRKHFGRPAIRTSGLRCKQHNVNEGGVSDSRHLSGKALDFRIEGNTATKTLAYVQSLPGVRYAYAIDSKHVHMDIE